MARFFSNDEIDQQLVKQSTVCVLGYGNQGRSHCLNLRDSGVNVIVGARPGGQSWSRAEAENFSVSEIKSTVQNADWIVMSLPDMAMAEVFTHEIVPNLHPGQTLIFLHGFNILYELIRPAQDVDVVLVSPKGAGAGVRARFVEGSGVPALVAVHQDATGAALSKALSYAAGIGCHRSLIMETTFQEETETDLFGEQAVLCGGVPALLQIAFETLVSRGNQPEAAYFECIHELKIIADLIYERGIAGMRAATSDTAQWGGLLAKETFAQSELAKCMVGLADRIQSRQFAKEWIQEAQSGSRTLRELREAEAHERVEAVGADLRRRMGLGSG